MAFIPELLNLIIAVVVVGYIFTGYVKINKRDPLEALTKRFDFEDFKFAIMISAPAVVLHELAHKFVAIGFGLNAIFQIFPAGLAIGIILKLIGSGFLILAPGYVLISGASPLQGSLIAFAGPLLNLGLFLGSWLYLKYNSSKSSRKTVLTMIMTKEINKWLFIFNMIPVPPLDGFKVIAPLLF